jgi:hypothetical protein
VNMRSSSSQARVLMGAILAFCIHKDVDIWVAFSNGMMNLNQRLSHLGGFK